MHKRFVVSRLCMIMIRFEMNSHRNPLYKCFGWTITWHWTCAGYDLISHGFSRVNTFRPRRNKQLFADDIFNCIFFNENVWISIKFSLKFVPKGPINNIPALVQIMAWRRSGDKPLSEPMMVSLPTHICVTRPQWVNPLRARLFRGKQNIYLHSMCFLHIDMTHVVEILPHVKQELTYSTQSISWVLMSWRL